MSPSPRPTPAELEILRVLWQRGPSTVREVQATLSENRSSGYTTVLKMLQIMADKNLVTRDETQRALDSEASVNVVLRWRRGDRSAATLRAFPSCRPFARSETTFGGTTHASTNTIGKFPIRGISRVIVQ